MSIKNYDVIVVGAGIAGMTAAIYVARAGKSVAIFEGTMHGGQIINAVGVKNWPGEASISGAELSQKIYHQVNNLGVEVLYENVASIVDTSSGDKTERFLVKTDSGEYSCGAIIIATGTEPKKLSGEQLEEAGKRPVLYCATCDGALYKDKPVAVVGGGNTAKHEAQYLEGLASKVYLVHRGESIPEEAAAIFVAIGRVPNTKFLQGLVELDAGGYIVAGEDCKTSLPGIFAAGDCRTKSVRQLVTAAGDGAASADAVLDYLK